MNVYGFNDVREAAVVQTAETVYKYPEPSGFDSQMTKIEDYVPGTDQVPGGLIQ
jgi:hypothetical protein